MTVIDVPRIEADRAQPVEADGSPPEPHEGGPPSGSPPGTDDEPGRLARLWRGRPEDPRWYRPALWALLLTTAVAYIWGLGASGWANSYYSAAVQAGASSWKAFFFGSFDASNAITVDKAPGALWIMGMSARIFGVNSWSILVPEALMGVGSVALVVATVKRWFRPGAALLSGLVLACTPVAVLMFRFNNPDAFLVLLLCGAAYAVTRALERASWRWITLAGSLVGFAFLAKMMQSFLVLPAFALVYLLAAPTSFWKRIGHLAAMGTAMVLSAGWWVAIVELWPASSRPYIGGSQNNSVLELVLGYNGLGRLTGRETGSVTRATPSGSGQWGPTGIFRMFNTAFGGQISWLLPAALLLLVAGLAWTLRRPRTDRSRAALIIWGGWLLVTGIVFSLGGGIIHEYYTVALAPAIAALVGIGASMAWDRRDAADGRAVMTGTVAVTAAWTWVLLGRTPDWDPWLRPTVVVLAVMAVVLLVAGRPAPNSAIRTLAAGSALAIALGLVVPLAASATTVDARHTGSLVVAGPRLPQAPRPVPTGTGASAAPRPGAGPERPAGMGAMLRTSRPPRDVLRLLRSSDRHDDWLVATTWSMRAAGFQLATRRPALAIGGFNGTDPAPTLEQFQDLVATHRVQWYLATDPLDPGVEQLGGSDAASRIAAWVASRWDPVVVDGVVMYDVGAPPGPGTTPEGADRHT